MTHPPITKKDIAEAFFAGNSKRVFEGLCQKWNNLPCDNSLFAGRVLSVYEYIKGQYGQAKATEFSCGMRNAHNDDLA